MDRKYWMMVIIPIAMLLYPVTAFQFVMGITVSIMVILTAGTCSCAPCRWRSLP